MSVTVPTIENLINQILSDKATEFGVSLSDLGRTINVETKVDAALNYLLYLTAAKINRNIFPDTADRDELLRWGNGLLNRNPQPAIAGQYVIEVNGNVGSTIPAQTTFLADDNSNAPGFLFVVDLDFTLTTTTDTLTVRALTPGLDSTLNVCNTLTSTQPLTNVNDQATVDSISVQPSNEEDIEEYREAILEALRLEPQGGSPSDYRLWVLDVPEVRTVYPYVKLSELGTIQIYVEATPQNSVGIPGQPSQATIDEVYKGPSVGVPESGAIVINPLNNRGRKPLGVFEIEIFPVDPLPVDVNFTALSDTSSPTLTLLRNAITELLFNVRPYIAGGDSLLTRNDDLTIGRLISAVIAVLDDVGATYTNLTMDVDGNEVVTFNFDNGQYPYLRNITNDGSPV